MSLLSNVNIKVQASSFWNILLYAVTFRFLSRSCVKFPFSSFRDSEHSINMFYSSFPTQQTLQRYSIYLFVRFSYSAAVNSIFFVLFFSLFTPTLMTACRFTHSHNVQQLVQSWYSWSDIKHSWLRPNMHSCRNLTSDW